MKKNLWATLLLTATFLQACDNDEATLHQKYFEQMKQEIFRDNASTASVTIQLQDDALSVTLGDARLYNSTDATRQKAANDIGMETLRIFGKNSSSLKTGMLLISKDTKNEVPDTTGIERVPINIDSLKKAAGQ